MVPPARRRHARRKSWPSSFGKCTPLAITTADVQSQGYALTARTCAWLLLSVFEILVTSWLFEVKPGVPVWQNPVFYLREFVLWLMLSAVAFAVTSWPQWAEMAARWREEQLRHNWRSALAAESCALCSAHTGYDCLYGRGCKNRVTSLAIVICSSYGLVFFFFVSRRRFGSYLSFLDFCLLLSSS